MKKIVTFASVRPKTLQADATLPRLLERMLDEWSFDKRFKDKQVAIKMHLGGQVGYSTIHPLFVAKVVQAVRKAGGQPFITDSPTAVLSAASRGYTAEVLGAPIFPVAGPADKYIYPKKAGYRTLKTVNVAGAIADADAMIVLSHGKGHGHSGFGGAIKNIAMGCVDGPTRGQIHRLTSAMFEWDSKKCRACMLCLKNCPNEAISYRNKRIEIFEHHCKYCMHCQLSCATGAISIDQSGYRHFQHGMAVTVREVLKTFEPSRVFYVTVLTNITPFCDCWGFTTPSIVPDIGIVAADDIVAVETAALDLIRAENFIEGSLPSPLKRSGSGHLLQQIHAKDPYMQVEECIRQKLGSSTYQLKTIE